MTEAQIPSFPAPPTPVPTVQRPINGMSSGAAAQLAGRAAEALLISHGIDPASAAILGGVAGSIVSGGMATVGSWARDVLPQLPPDVRWALVRLPLMFAARIG